VLFQSGRLPQEPIYRTHFNRNWPRMCELSTAKQREPVQDLFTHWRSKMTKAGQHWACQHSQGSSLAKGLPGTQVKESSCKREGDTHRRDSDQARHTGEHLATMGHQSGRGKGRVTRASVQFRGQEPPLLRLKLPVSGFFGAPLFAGCTVGGSPADLALHLGTLVSEGPSLRLTYRPVAAGFATRVCCGRTRCGASVGVGCLCRWSTRPSRARGRTGGALRGGNSWHQRGWAGAAGGRGSGVSPGLRAGGAQGWAGSARGCLGAALSLRLEVDLLRPKASRLLFKLQPCVGDASIRRFPTSGLPSACSMTRVPTPAEATALAQEASPTSGPAAYHVSSISRQPGPVSELQAGGKSPGPMNGFRALPQTQSSPTPLTSSPSSLRLAAHARRPGPRGAGCFRDQCWCFRAHPGGSAAKRPRPPRHFWGHGPGLLAAGSWRGADWPLGAAVCDGSRGGTWQCTAQCRWGAQAF